MLGKLGCGLGAVFRDVDGAVSAAGSFQCQDIWEPRVAEAKTIYYGIKLAKELGYRLVEVESDSLLAIQALKNGRTGCSEFDLIIDDILAFVGCFDNSGNRVAHMLAHFQPWEVGKRIWVDDIPVDFMFLAMNYII